MSEEEIKIIKVTEDKYKKIIENNDKLLMLFGFFTILGIIQMYIYFVWIALFWTIFLLGLLIIGIQIKRNNIKHEKNIEKIKQHAIKYKKIQTCFCLLILILSIFSFFNNPNPLFLTLNFILTLLIIYLLYNLTTKNIEIYDDN